MPISRNLKLGQNVPYKFAGFDTVSHQTYIHVGNQHWEESPMKGFDIEGGIAIPKIPNFYSFLSYYYFTHDHSQSIHGARIRTNYSLLNWLDLEGEYSFDKTRKSTYFLGIRLHHAFG